MAHTDKTDPYRVQVHNDPHAVVFHHHCCEDNPQPSRLITRTQPCDLPNVGEYTRGTDCHRWSYATWLRLYNGGGNAHDTHTFYYGPERARTRTALNAARRDYNTHGDTDVDVRTDQHRHTPWGGGWWD
jgi:hypothetical protein